MTVNSVNSTNLSKDALSQLTQADSKKSTAAQKSALDTTQIKNKIKSSKKKYTADQLVKEFGISKQQADKILKDLEQANKTTKGQDTQTNQQKGNSEGVVREKVSEGNPSTIQFRV